MEWLITAMLKIRKTGLPIKGLACFSVSDSVAILYV